VDPQTSQCEHKPQSNFLPQIQLQSFQLPDRQEHDPKVLKNADSRCWVHESLRIKTLPWYRGIPIRIDRHTLEWDDYDEGNSLCDDPHHCYVCYKPKAFVEEYSEVEEENRDFCQWLEDEVKDLGDIIELFESVCAVGCCISGTHLSETQAVLGGNVPEVFSEAAGSIWDMLAFLQDRFLASEIILNIGMMVIGIIMSCCLKRSGVVSGRSRPFVLTYSPKCDGPVIPPYRTSNQTSRPKSQHYDRKCDCCDDYNVSYDFSTFWWNWDTLADIILKEG